MGLIKKAVNKLSQLTAPVFNMRLHKAEQFYYRQYWHTMQQYMPDRASILDIGCQHGRFTIPMLEAGYNVTATDIKQKFLNDIKAHAPASALLTLRKEKLETTIANKSKETYDIILCFELLYLFPNYEKLIGRLKKMLNPGGKLMISHRSKGYYTYRFQAEGDSTSAMNILDNNHAHYNAQTTDELSKMYASLGMELHTLKGIGVLSGFDKDPFRTIANPARMKTPQLEKLFALETSEHTQHNFINSARYILAIAQNNS